MQHNTFYGTEKISSISYLEFGAIDLDSSKKLVWDLKLHQKAYDWYMHARYSNDILCYLTMKEQLNTLSMEDILTMYCTEVHHKDDFSVTIGKLAALSVAQTTVKQGTSVSFFELGQTLFGCIDALQFCQTLLSQTNISHDPVPLHDVQWQGVDISNFFNRFAILMHGAYNVQTFDDIKLLNGIQDVFFAKGVTLLYTIRTIEHLVELLNSAKICIFDYSFATHEEHEVIIGSGKVVKYLWLGDFIQRLKELPGKIYVKKGNSFFDGNNKRVTLDCLYADEKNCQEFISIDQSMRHAFNANLGKMKGIDTLLDTTNHRNSGWMLLEDFLEPHCCLTK